MEIIYVENNNEAGKVAFELFEDEIKKGAKVLGLATGSSPLPLYEQFVQSDIDFSNLISINLDEYVGLNADHHQSYHYFMYHHLFKFKQFKASYVPDGSKEEDEAIAEYEQILDKHPIDIQLLGIGRNGHIGFNEPGTSFNSKTHKVELAQSTIEANKRFFSEEEEVPKYAYTMGLESIMRAKKIVLIACGENKKDAIYGLVKGEVSENLPASILQNHPDVTLIIDEKAGSKL